MDIVSTYSIKIKEYNHIFKESIEQYRSAVKFFVDVCLKEWNEILQISSLQYRQSYVESKTVISKNRKVVPYNFNVSVVNEFVLREKVIWKYATLVV